MTTKNLIYAAALITIFLAPAIASAQALGGCVNSPENPTAILALVGALSGAIALRRR